MVATRGKGFVTEWAHRRLLTVVIHEAQRPAMCGGKETPTEARRMLAGIDEGAR